MRRHQNDVVTLTLAIALFIYKKTSYQKNSYISSVLLSSRTASSGDYCLKLAGKSSALSQM